MTTFSRAKFPACAEIITVARALFGDGVKVRYVRQGPNAIGAPSFKQSVVKPRELRNVE